MRKRDRIVMSQKELMRWHILTQILEKKITRARGAEEMGVTGRQIRRLLKRVGEEGAEGVCHRGRGRVSNRQLGEEIKGRALQLYQEKYWDFGPTLATEKLWERDQIRLGQGTLRLWLKEGEMDYPTRSARRHRRWRMRKRGRGEMVQMDGSRHAWFEGRGPACVLMGYIDDATGEVFGRFYEYEGTIPALDGFARYVKRYGLPLSVYLDRHTTYKSNAKPTVEEALAGAEPMSQFERGLGELGVKVIHAYSPQAKGRIERLFGTFQNRVLREMRLEKVSTIQEANLFLERYLPVFNKRFRVIAADPVDLHRKCPPLRVLERTLCVKEERVLRNDFTIAYEGQLYQVEEKVRARKVVVEKRLSGSLHITYRGNDLRYKAISARPVKEAASEPTRQRVRRSVKPSVDHPWRQYLFGQRLREDRTTIRS